MKNSWVLAIVLFIGCFQVNDTCRTNHLFVDRSR